MENRTEGEFGKLVCGGALSPRFRGFTIEQLHRQVLRGRVFVALHMHAGDGNVHTNIPVNSDDYDMLQTANHAVDRIWRLPNV